MTTKLAAQNLEVISTFTATPGYERSALSAGIVHFGVGNFHRAHQAVYLDALFNSGRDHGWAIVGAGVLPSDEKMRRVLADQDYLTTVVEQSASHSAARVTGAMIDGALEIINQPAHFFVIALQHCNHVLRLGGFGKMRKAAQITK